MYFLNQIAKINLNLYVEQEIRFPEFPSPNGSELELAKSGMCKIFGRQK